MSQVREYRMLIDGAWLPAEDGAIIESVNPSDNRIWATFPSASAADVDRAVRAAHHAMYDGPWSRLTATERGKLLYRLADLLSENAGQLADVETKDTGKLPRETLSQIRYVAEYIRYFAGCADKLEGATLPIDKQEMFVMTTREQIGVVAAVIPWNSQLMLTAVKLGPALAAGNAIVIKASEHAPAPLLEFGRLCGEAGFPPGIINIVTGVGNPCGQTLTSHPLVARIAFTGGTSAARQVIRNSAENFASVSLELGGKSPIIVFDDADLDNAVNAILAGNFGASGQSCVAGSRVFIQAGVFEEVIARVAARAREIKIGDPLAEATEMGPLATKDQRDKIETVLASSVEAGAKLVTGGRRPQGVDAGFYFEPTVLVCADADTPAARTELFGPVLCAFRFDDESDVIARANDSEFGLAAGVFTRDVARAMRVMKRVRSGIVLSLIHI